MFGFDVKQNWFTIYTSDNTTLISATKKLQLGYTVNQEIGIIYINRRLTILEIGLNFNHNESIPTTSLSISLFT